MGTVLAGGRSSRFGSDKALALWEGQTLLDRAIATLTPWCHTVAVVGRDWPGRVRIDDRPHVGLGPLGGIAGALEYAQFNGFDSVLTIACDMPEVPRPVLAALAVSAPAYCSDAPVLGHWPAALAKDLINHLFLPPPPPFVSSEVEERAADAAPAFLDHARNERDGLGARGTRSGTVSVHRWAEQIGATPIPTPTLRNINTLADLPA